MASKRELIQALVKGIRLDIQGYQQLKQLLAMQRKLMLRRDNQGLLTHNAQQDALVHRLSLRASQRCQYLLKIGVTADAKGIDRLIKALPANSGKQLADYWAQLMLLVKEAQAANEQNGKLLVLQQEVINSLLARENQNTVDYGMPQEKPFAANM